MNLIMVGYFSRVLIFKKLAIYLTITTYLTFLNDRRKRGKSKSTK